MKFASFLHNNTETFALVWDDKLYPLAACGQRHDFIFPQTAELFLADWERLSEKAREFEEFIKRGKVEALAERNRVTLLSPIPRPTSCRDGYAFRQHVATARRNRGVPMIEEFDQYPVFYFTNHRAVFGEGELTFETDHFRNLDFELEAAVVIAKPGKNIRAERADSYVAGYTIMNDLSARVLQMDEMKLNLGPAKGKDFATSLGPYLVTPDELMHAGIPAHSGHTGQKFNLRMTAKHNDRLVSDGNLGDMNWTFAEIIERCAYGVELAAGDVIGSGTVGTGCYLELNGTWALEAKEKGTPFSPVWLRAGDRIELAIEGMGSLNNTIKRSSEEWSILAQNKVTY